MTLLEKPKVQNSAEAAAAGLRCAEIALLRWYSLKSCQQNDDETPRLQLGFLAHLATQMCATLRWAKSHDTPPPPQKKKYFGKKTSRGIIFWMIATIFAQSIAQRTLSDIFSRELRTFRVTQHRRV